MTLGRLLWSGVKIVAKKAMARARAIAAEERRLAALTAEVKCAPQNTYPSFGQAVDRMVFEEKMRKAREAFHATDLDVKESMGTVDEFAEACMEQGRAFDAMC